SLGRGRGRKRGLEEKGGLETPHRGRNGGPESTTGAGGGLESINGSDFGIEKGGEKEEGGLEMIIGSPMGKGRGGKRGEEGDGSGKCVAVGQERGRNGGLDGTNGAEGGVEIIGSPMGKERGGGRGREDMGGSGSVSLGSIGKGRGGKRGREGKETKRSSPEDCAVISLGEDDDDDDDDDDVDEGPGRHLAALEAVQLELEAVEEEAARAFRRLRAKFGLRRRPHLQRRNRLIQRIPGFWVTADGYGAGLGGYMEDPPPTPGHLVSHSTPIRWWQGQDPRCQPQKGPPPPRSFFTWFGDHSFPAGDRVAEVSTMSSQYIPVYPSILPVHTVHPSAPPAPEGCVWMDVGGVPIICPPPQGVCVWMDVYGGGSLFNLPPPGGVYGWMYMGGVPI
uniref:Uncharacterized protein n=1 Tax=Coturnix japonica TaxID=93934 RepID=A0A8C2SME7_COTJA